MAGFVEYDQVCHCRGSDISCARSFPGSSAQQENEGPQRFQNYIFPAYGCCSGSNRNGLEVALQSAVRSVQQYCNLFNSSYRYMVCNRL